VCVCGGGRATAHIHSTSHSPREGAVAPITLQSLVPDVTSFDRKHWLRVAYDMPAQRSTELSIRVSRCLTAIKSQIASVATVFDIATNTRIDDLHKSSFAYVVGPRAKASVAAKFSLQTPTMNAAIYGDIRATMGRDGVIAPAAGVLANVTWAEVDAHARIEVNDACDETIETARRYYEFRVRNSVPGACECGVWRESRSLTLRMRTDIQFSRAQSLRTTASCRLTDARSSPAPTGGNAPRPPSTLTRSCACSFRRCSIVTSSATPPRRGNSRNLDCLSCTRAFSRTHSNSTHSAAASRQRLR
jgi:hypothetical protein